MLMEKELSWYWEAKMENINHLIEVGGLEQLLLSL